jgi:hypothetical protein
MEQKWDSAHEWLVRKASTWDHDELLRTFYQVVKLLDGAQIEDLFEDEMEIDGYFDEVKD